MLLFGFNHFNPRTSFAVLVGMCKEGTGSVMVDITFYLLGQGSQLYGRHCPARAFGSNVFEH